MNMGAERGPSRERAEEWGLNIYRPRYAMVGMDANARTLAAIFGYEKGFDAGREAAMARTCEWVRSTDRHGFTRYNTACLMGWEADGNEADMKRWKACHYCGGKLVVVAAQDRR